MRGVGPASEASVDSWSIVHEVEHSIFAGALLLWWWVDLLYAEECRAKECCLKCFHESAQKSSFCLWGFPDRQCYVDSDRPTSHNLVSVVSLSLSQLLQKPSI